MCDLYSIRESAVEVAALFGVEVPMWKDTAASRIGAA
jgi:hypothetical protein